jgi:hypothetical protein
LSNDPRYGKEWRKTANRTKDMLNGQCVFCGSRELDAHHAYYGSRGLLGNTYKPDLEIPGWSVFPLCQNHHSRRKGMAHHLDNYQFDSNPWTNSNTQTYLWKLRFHFWLKYCRLQATEVIVGFVCVYILLRLIIG